MPQVMPSSSRDPRGHREGLLIGDLHDFIHERHVENVRDEAGADALNFVLARRAARHHRAVDRFDGDGFERVAFFLLDVAGHAGDGSARAHARHENVDLAFGVVPDFRAGGLEVDFRVGRVFELLRHEVFRVARRDSSALAMAPFMPSAPGVRIRFRARRISASSAVRCDMVSGMVNVR